MAALLRSARLLRLTPSGSLQITGTSRTGPPLHRLYSGALGGRTPGVCSRQTVPGPANRCVWRHVAGVRGYAAAPEERDDSSLVVRSKQAEQFDWALAKLDSAVRRTGRITKTMLLRVFHDICRTGYPSGNQALLLLRSCGSLLPEVLPAERTKLAHHIWDKLQELNVSYDVSHFNALLKVYLQNDFRFSPTDFLTKMEAASVQPNRVTYQRLIGAYCQEGDIEGASTILGFMKNKDLAITEAVFNSLVTGHARAGDMESAESILPVMRGAGIEPGPDTYVALLTAYAEKGDFDKIKQTLEMVDSADDTLMDRDIMQVVFSLTKAGHSQHVPEILERIRHDKGYIPDAMNLCLSLVTQGQEDMAFSFLKTIPVIPTQEASEAPSLGNFFIRHCVNIDMPVEKISKYCKELQESNLHASPLLMSILCALENRKSALCFQLMKLAKEQGLPVRPHYFWPLLTPHVKDKNPAGVLEVVKGMQDVGVPLDPETISGYIVPAFHTLDAAWRALADAGVSRDSNGYLAVEVRSIAATNLASLYTMLSDPSFPSVDLFSFRGSLIIGFKKCDDVESMAKITELLISDERFSKPGGDPVETVSYFLYNLIDAMTETEVQAKEEQLRQYFQNLKALNIGLPVGICRGIKKILEAYGVPELSQDVYALAAPSDPDRAKAPSDRRVQDPDRPRPSTGYKLAKLEELKAAGKPCGGLLKQILQTLCAEETSQKLQQALALKVKYEDEMLPGGYATLIDACCRHDDVNEAVNLKMELSRKDSSVVLDPTKYMGLVKILANHGRLEEALDILKEMKEKDVSLRDYSTGTLFHLLNTSATKGDVDTIKRLQETVFSLGLATPTTNLCSPLVTAYLLREDLPGALEAAMSCQKRYGVMPRIHDIIIGLVDKGDTELLQKGMDFVSQERGEMTMLYDLFFAFMSTGRYREARKIIETPGLRAKSGPLTWYAEKCIANKQVECLENLVEITAKLFESDRDDMYCFLLRLYKETGDWRKAEATWTKMQEENVVPRQRTLHVLADIFKSSGQEVPFQEPEKWWKPEEVEVPLTAPDVQNTFQARLEALCKKGQTQEAFSLLKSADKNEVILGPGPYDRLIRRLLAEGLVDNAMAVRDIAVSHLPNFRLSDIARSLLILTQARKGQSEESLIILRSMVEEELLPTVLSVTRLVQLLGVQGNVSAIQEVETLTKGLRLTNIMYANNKALAHIKNGDLEQAAELLEEMVSTPEGARSSMAYVFRKVLEDNNDKAFDRLSVMAERQANHFASYRPATDMFLELIDVGKIEEAKFMLARCSAVAEQKKILTSYVAKMSRKPGQPAKIKNIMMLVPDFDKHVGYSYLMKSYCLGNDFESAKALYDQMSQEGVEMDSLSLKRLAQMYHTEGQNVPFPEPPESYNFYATQMKEQLNKNKTPVVE